MSLETEVAWLRAKLKYYEASAATDSAERFEQKCYDLIGIHQTVVPHQEIQSLAHRASLAVTEARNAQMAASDAELETRRAHDPSQ